MSPVPLAAVLGYRFSLSSDDIIAAG